MPTMLRVRLLRAAHCCASVLAKCFWYPERSVADVLWRPLRLFVQAPAFALVVYTICNAAFIFFAGLSQLLSKLIYPAGTVVVWAIMFGFLCQFLARLVAYPGSINFVRRSVENSFGKDIATKLKETANLTNSAVRLMVVKLDVKQSLEAMAMVRAIDSSFIAQMKDILRISAEHEWLSPDGVHVRQLFMKWSSTFQEFDRLMLELSPTALSALPHAIASVFGGAPAITRTPPASPIASPEPQPETGPGSQVVEDGVSTPSTTPILKDRARSNLLSPGSSTPCVPQPKAASTSGAALAQAVQVVKMAATITEMTNDLVATAPLFYEPDIPPGYLRSIKSALRSLRRTRAIATLDLLRADFMARYDARRISFSAKDGTLLDGAIVVAADKQCHVDLHPTNENPPDTAATSTDTRLVVLCNPNAAFYEGHHYWVEFYTRLGLDVAVWNYRGYGASQGTPSPSRCRSDLLQLLQTVRENFGYNRFALHGESIGGLAACFAASVDPHVEFLLADRTFSSLAAASTFLLGKWSAPLVRYVVRWPENNVRPFVDAPCYKVAANDTSDEIVQDGASLRTGIAEWTVRGVMTKSRKKGRTAPASSAPGGATSQARKPEDAATVDVSRAVPAVGRDGGDTTIGREQSDAEDAEARLPLIGTASSASIDSSNVAPQQAGGAFAPNATATGDGSGGNQLPSEAQLEIEKFRDCAERLLQLAGQQQSGVITAESDKDRSGNGALEGWFKVICRLHTRAVLVQNAKRVIEEAAERQMEAKVTMAAQTPNDATASNAHGADIELGETTPGADTTGEGNNDDAVGSASPQPTNSIYPPTATAAFIADNDWVVGVATQLLQLDGGCALMLHHAVERGFNAFRNFVLSLLIWRAVDITHRAHPRGRFNLLYRLADEHGDSKRFKTIASVQAYIRTYAPASDLEVQHVHAFLSFLQDGIARLVEEMMRSPALQKALGHQLPLTCGHNQPYSFTSEAMLAAHLGLSGFLNRDQKPRIS